MKLFVFATVISTVMMTGYAFTGPSPLLGANGMKQGLSKVGVSPPTSPFCNSPGTALQMGYDTEFTSDNVEKLKEAGLYSKTLVKLGAATGPYPVEWKQVKKQLIGSTQEDYYVCKFAEAGPDGKPKKGSPHWNVIIAAKVGIDAINGFDTFSTNGVQLGGDCVLHFGYASLTADSAEIFLVIHPNWWGPYQKRFRDVLRVSNFAHQTLDWAAGAAASAGASAALTAYLGGAAAVGSTGVGIPIAIAAGVVGFVTTDAWDRLVGDYLRFVGE